MDDSRDDVSSFQLRLRETRRRRGQHQGWRHAVIQFVNRHQWIYSVNLRLIFFSLWMGNITVSTAGTTAVNLPLEVATFFYHSASSLRSLSRCYRCGVDCRSTCSAHTVGFRVGLRTSGTTATEVHRETPDCLNWASSSMSCCAIYRTTSAAWPC